MINELKMMWKKRLWSNLKYNYSICLERLRKTKKNIRIAVSGATLEPKPPEYETGMLSAQLCQVENYFEVDSVSETPEETYSENVYFFVFL